MSKRVMFAGLIKRLEDTLLGGPGEASVEVRTAAAQGTSSARVVAAFDTLELDHLGAQIGQDHAGERPGEHLAQLQDAYALKRSAHGTWRRSGMGQSAGTPGITTA